MAHRAQDPLPPPREWIRWLTGSDAAVLLMHLCDCIEDPAVDHATVVTMVQDWRRQALEALAADDWTASVDEYLEVRVDARLWLLSQGKLHTG